MKDTFLFIFFTNNTPHSTPHYPFFLPLNSTNYINTLFDDFPSRQNNPDALSSHNTPTTSSSSTPSLVLPSPQIHPENLVDMSSISVSAPTRQSTTVKQPSAYLSDYFCSHAVNNN